ncbi:hypothetical protein GGR57DRAFT_516754 [Xylariaceae sp. FL1272]|nr:hypothetical protein GGR57DRAFT_516754 [Xylariaceae sp. FL1272]
MFTTWRYDNDAGYLTQARTFDPTTAKTIGHSACSSCRAQKLKCNGERSGCQRCKAHDRVCSYGDTGRQKKLPSEAQESTGPPKAASSTASSISMSSPLPSAHQRQEEKLQRRPEQQQEQQQDHEQEQDDLTWLMAQPHEIGFFAGSEFLENVGGITEPPDALLDLSSSMPDDDCSLHRNHLQQASQLEAMEDDSEETSKSYGLSSTACQCLYRVVIIMDKLDVPDDHALDKSLNDLLVLHKRALSNTSKMLECTTCTTKIENMMILAILLDRLARLCQRIVRVTGDPTHPTPTLSLGDYQVDSTEEYVALIHSLLGVQLRRLQGLAQGLKHVSLHFHSNMLSNRLGVCIGLVTASLDALRNVGRCN